VPTVAVPIWNAAGVLPPNDSADPMSTQRSPYRVSLLDVVTRFATSPERRRILRGWLGLRAGLHGMGLSSGFQWLDGSFLEHIEVLERRVPKDIDVVTFVDTPPTFAPDPTQVAHLDHDWVKQTYAVDHYFVELNQMSPANLVSKAAYWYSMWSHRRDAAWKGFLQVDLNTIQDHQALAWLDLQDQTQVRP